MAEDSASVPSDQDPIAEAGADSLVALAALPEELQGHAPALRATPPAPPTPLLVPHSVSQAKLEVELADWRTNEDLYRRRGWLLLNADGLDVSVAFVAKVAVGEMQLPVVTAAITLRYDNYDLWPPSLTFIDAMTGQPAIPQVAALDRLDNGEVRNVLLGHPTSQQPFLCLPGLREYHEHPQHNGDDWLLHRNAGEGRLAVVCDRVWRRMARNVMGLSVTLQSLPGVGTQLAIGLMQGDVDIVSGPAVEGP